MNHQLIASQKLRLGLAVAGALAVASASHAQNISFGPFSFNLGMSAGMVYTDNVNSSPTHPKPDYQLTLGPNMGGGLNMDVPLSTTGGQRFQLTMSANWRHSLTGNQSDSFGAPLGATLTLPIYVMKWQVVFADAFSFTDDPLETTFAYNRAKLAAWNNSATLTASRNFGRFALSFGAMRLDKIYPDAPRQEETQAVFSITPSYFLRENYSVFWGNTLGLTFPADPTRPESVSMSTSIGVSGQIAPSLSGSVSIGFSHAQFQSVTQPGDGSGIFGGIFNKKFTPPDNIDGINSMVALNYSHPLRPNTTYTVSYVHAPGITALLDRSIAQDMHVISLIIAHRLTRELTLVPGINWSHIEAMGNGSSGEVADLLQIKLGIQRQLTSKLYSSFDYTYNKRSSNLPASNYDVNRVAISFTYRF